MHAGKLVLQGRSQQTLLPAKLFRIGDVLPGAATTLPEMAAARLDPRGGTMFHFDDARAPVAATSRYDFSDYLLARDRSGDKEHVLAETGDPFAGQCQVADFEQ